MDADETTMSEGGIIVGLMSKLIDIFAFLILKSDVIIRDRTKPEWIFRVFGAFYENEKKTFDRLPRRPWPFCLSTTVNTNHQKLLLM